MNIMRPLGNYRLFLILTGVLFVMGCEKKNPKPQFITPQVDVLIVKKQNIEDNILVNGDVLAWDKVDIYPEWSGRITYINFPDGGAVKAGDLLIKIFDDDLLATLKGEQADSTIAALTEERYRKLLAQNSITQSDYDNALSTLEKLKANILVTRVQISYTHVRARFDGHLGLRVVSLGQYITPSTYLGTIQSDKVKVDFNLPEIYAKSVRVGAVFVAQSPAGTKRQIRVVAIQPDVNIASRSLKLRAVFDDGLPPERPGTFLKVIYNLFEDRSIAVIPTQCLLQDADSDHVVVVNHGIAMYRSVIPGNRTPNGVEIVSGLDNGDTLVVNGANYVRANHEVEIDKYLTFKPVPNTN